jgi:hypothetical protein
MSSGSESELDTVYISVKDKEHQIEILGSIHSFTLKRN